MPDLARNSGYEPIGDATYQTLATGRQDEALPKIYGYQNNKTRTILFHILCICFAGIPYVIFCWYPRCKVIKYKRCSLNIADLILLRDSHGHYEFIEVKAKHSSVPNLGPITLRHFYYQHTKYAFLQGEGSFVPLDAFIPTNTLEDLLENSIGLTPREQRNLLELYGPNTIEIEVKSYWRLFVEEVFNPFYVFQLFSMVLWSFDDYMIYAGCVLFLTLFSIITSLIQTRKQSQALHDLVESSNTETVHILRPNILFGHTEYPVNPTNLAPGDLIVIPPTGCIMACDAVLLTGNCIVNESMLTGESVPVTKTPPHSSQELYDPSVHKRHTLFSGTHVLQTRYYGGQNVLARVVRTGFDTTKGALVKSILFPTPVGLKFYSDSLKFVLVLFVIALTGMGYCIHIYIRRHADVKDVIIRTLDIITIVVPPALPAAMTVGTVYSQSRLKKLGIFCISPPRINICGKLKLACFDKTGTLTHEGLELYSVVPCVKTHFVEPITDMTELDSKNYLVQAMATCHSLTRIDGQLTGDPLDMNMFANTNWELEEAGADENARYDLLGPTVVKPKKKYYQVDDAAGDFDVPYEIGIVRQFPFSSSQQCMSVICRVLGSSGMLVYTKGAPEKVAALCQKETLPLDFNQRLSETTAQGFRVIALAYKYLPTKFKWKDAQKTNRDVVECDLMFLGFLIMQNTLKPETTPVISTLHDANIRTVMITGDNIRTAISVARDCGMVKVHEDVVIIGVTSGTDVHHIPSITTEKLASSCESNDTVISFNSSNVHFAMDGRTWAALRAYYPDLIPGLLVRTTIFARFQPDQKTQLIAQFQKLDYIVSMVGDGANDCGALKAAHVGVSLSQAEASVAAPFTSSIEDISCILYLILEGRCALVTSFAVFKYMALYSLIQFFSVLVLYTNHSIMGDMQFLFVDLIITTSLAVTIGRQGPHNKLVPTRPMGSLVSTRNLIPLILQIILCGAVQLGALYFLMQQSWYEPLPRGREEVVICWENTVIFCISSFQYLILALVYSKGKPYRESLMNNFYLLIIAVALTCFITWLLVYPPEELAEFFEIIYLIRHTHEQKVFRYQLLLFPVTHLVLAVFIEACIAECTWLKKVVHCITWKTRPRNKYKVLLRDTDFSELLQS